MILALISHTFSFMLGSDILYQLNAEVAMNFAGALR